MAKTASNMLALGTLAPDFALKDAKGQTFTRDGVAGAQGLLVMFLCNHCPYVQLIADVLARATESYRAQGVGVVAINSNDFDAYPDDAPAKMLTEAAQRGYQFPYLIDQSQAIAHAYQAACTPDFYLFDRALQLVYRGQFDGARPGNGVAVTGVDLTAAVKEMVAGQKPSPDQRPSIGCNIKWRPGCEPNRPQAN